MRNETTNRRETMTEINRGRIERADSSISRMIADADALMGASEIASRHGDDDAGSHISKLRQTILQAIVDVGKQMDQMPEIDEYRNEQGTQFILDMFTA